MTASRRRVGFPSAAVFLLTAAFITTKTARDALYIQDEGLRQVALGFVLIAVLSIPQARLVLASVARFGPRPTRVGMLLLGALGLSLYFPFATAGTGLLNGLFFVAVPLVFSVLFSMTWLLTSELMEGKGQAEVAAAYGRVTVASMLGGTVGATAAGGVVAIIGPRGLLLIGAGQLVAAALVTAWAHMRFRLGGAVSSAAVSAGRQPAARDVLRSPYARLLAAIAAAGAFAAVMIEFQFYESAALSGRGSQANAAYFSTVYLVVNASALILQLVFGARLQRFVGLAGALMVLPLVLFGGGTALALGSVYVVGAGLRIAEGGLRSSIHRSNWEQAFVGIEHRRRPIAKVLVDGLSASLAAGLAAAMLYGWLTFGVTDAGPPVRQATWISVAIVLSTLAWIGATMRLRRRLQMCAAEPHPFMPSPLAHSCPTTATLGGAVYDRAPSRAG